MCKVTADVGGFTGHSTRLITFMIKRFLYLSWEYRQLYVFTLGFVAIVKKWLEVLRWDSLHECEVIEIWEWVIKIFQVTDMQDIVRSLPGLQYFFNTLLLFVPLLGEKKRVFSFFFLFFYRAYLDVNELKNILKLDGSTHLNIFFANSSEEELAGVATWPWDKEALMHLGEW